MDLPVEIQFLQMEFASRGRRLPWLGPALRGMVARAVKNRFCRWPVPERDNRWKSCRGCPHMDGCPYGLTFEPDPPRDRNVLRTVADGQRAISLSPCFPVKEESCPGDVVQVRMVLLGRRAIDAGPEVIRVLTHPTQRFTLGSDQAEVAFRKLTSQPDWPSGSCRPGNSASHRMPLQAVSLGWH